MGRGMRAWALLAAVFALLAIIAGFEIAAYAGAFGRVVWHVDTKDKVLFLTFDDGPSENTRAVLDILRENGVKATFFVVGKQAATHPDAVRAILKEGHGLGVHSMTHPWLWKNASEEIVLSKMLTENIAGSKVSLFRPPHGFMTPFVALEAEENNLTVVMWNVFPYDYKRGADEIISKVEEKIKPGSIIVLHDGPGNRSEMIEALPRIIAIAKSRNYSFGLLEDYLRD
ncbi:polysaccharide deacetylase family protein [Candidatus Woesearchaeota archaeon]|nr:MAG: polysaccharide deacetylase family protein [Candidatus Woesearchaeota archaeon]